MESSLEHPYFVYGQGWASCNPERTLQSFGLKVYNLQVGDILISLTPRETTTSSSPRSSTIITTATTTAMTVRQVSAANQRIVNLATSNLNVGTHHKPIIQNVGNHHHVKQHQAMHMNRPSQSISPESLARKRRWSAPEQICDENDQVARRARME